MTMSDPINFVLVPSSGITPPIPEVPCPSCVKELLDLFETICVVGCCDWDALDFSDDHVQELVASGRSTLPRIRGILEEVNDWSASIQQPVIIHGDGWYFDPEEARKELDEALARLEMNAQKSTKDSPC
jgi:hypothetical protein